MSRHAKATRAGWLLIQHVSLLKNDVVRAHSSIQYGIIMRVRIMNVEWQQNVIT